VRGYRAAGGDPGSDRLLAVLCSIRALVRAKVDCCVPLS
jgi:aminoglycoside phosphotransferase family enzyme